jgi:hypothetical protein
VTLGIGRRREHRDAGQPLVQLAEKRQTRARLAAQLEPDQVHARRADHVQHLGGAAEARLDAELRAADSSSSRRFRLP